MLSIFRNRFVMKVIVAYVIIAHISQLIGPSELYALTSGPTTPEVSSFTPVGTSELVNVTTGNFSYNIPLLDVGGYPINISYDANTSMEDEASVVGFGWNLNIGAINRSLRGLPDEFRGDVVSKETHMKENVSWGLDLGYNKELFGVDLFKKSKKLSGKFGVKVGIGLNHNNYSGYNFSPSINPTLSVSAKNLPSLSLGMGISSNGISTKMGLDYKKETKETEEKGNKSFSLKAKLSYNTRSGLKKMTIDGGYNEKKNKAGKGNRFSHNISKSISFNPTYTPKITNPNLYTSGSLTFKAGGEASAFFGNLALKGHINKQFLLNQNEEVPAYGYKHLEEAIQNSRRSNNDNLEQPGRTAENQNRALMDFNREKESLPIIPMKKDKSKDGEPEKPLRGTHNLAVPQLTYDLLMVNSQGIGGQFRPYRSELGTVSDPVARSYSVGLSGAEVEVGFGAILRLGGDINYNVSASRSGHWLGGRKFLKHAQFRKDMSPNSNPSQFAQDTYEPVYYKAVGEMNVETAPEFYNSLYQERSIRPQLGTWEMLHKTTNKFETENEKGKTITLDGDDYYHRTARARRNTALYSLNGTEANITGLDRQIRSYQLNQPYYNLNTGVSAIHRANDRPAHHPSEVYVKDESGMRHVFGIPAMNIQQQDVTFNTANLLVDAQEGLVSYTPGIHNSDQNDKGIEKYYNRKSLPPYAYAYHLTAMLSPDYVDIMGDGITDDDLGTAYKFNYSRVHEDFGWRAPYQMHRASHNEGLESKGLVWNQSAQRNEKNQYADDKGMYTYGQKEIWLINSIETKGEYGFVAEFKYSEQDGGLGVAGENGDKDLNRLQRQLDRIELYSKKDRLENQQNATPIKVVHFSYEDENGNGYKLFRGVPNSTDQVVSGTNLANTKGKLTLKAIWFTYGQSNRARLNPYKFTYNGEDAPGTSLNPYYKFKAQNGWGTYRENTTSPYTWEYPFVDETDIHDRSMACLLKSIQLPSGGIMNIEYESHDYAYVQDKHAMKMFKLLGVGKDAASGLQPDNLLYEKTTNPRDFTEYNTLFVELPQATTTDDFKKRYLRDMLTKDSDDKQKYLYLNARVSVSPPNASNAAATKKYEQITYYYQIKDAGVVLDPNAQTGTRAWIKLKPKHIRRGATSDKKEVNPISFKAWSLVRKELNELIFPSSNPMLTEGEDGLGQARGLTGLINDLKIMVSGYNNMLRSRQIANEIDPEHSWMRLYEPTGFRKGGGARVKKIVLDDNYASMIAAMPADVWQTDRNKTAAELYKNGTYGQQYQYTTEDADFLEGKQEIISSGVASNLPGGIRAENPLVQPKFFLQRVALHPDTDIMMEEPLGEQFMPSPSIVYSKVTVRPLKESRIECSASGYTVHEHYTAKDFPVRFDETTIGARKTPSWIFTPFTNTSLDYYSATQGYTTIKNDMHGKLKRTAVYGQDPVTPISATEHYYRVDDAGKLDNEAVPVVMPNGSRTTARIGVEMDAVVDARQFSSTTMSGDFEGNFDLAALGWLPIPIPTGWPVPTMERTRLRTIVLSKLIHQFGILDSVVAYDNGACISTSNRAWDAETGEVLLTQIQNEFNDDRFAFNYPARWAYREMGAASFNQDMTWTAEGTNYLHFASLTNGQDYRDFFALGDKLLISPIITFGPVPISMPMMEIWVTNVYQTGVELMDRTGRKIDYSHPAIQFQQIKIVESGRKNTIKASMAAMTTTKDPFDQNNQLSPQGKVLDASAIEYDDKALIICGPLVKHEECLACDNPSVEAKQFLALMQALADQGLWLSTTPINITDALTHHDASGQKILNELGLSLDVEHTCGITDCDIFYQAELTPNDECARGLKVKFLEDCGSGIVPVSGCQQGFDLNFDFSQFPDGELFCLHHITRLSEIEGHPEICETDHRLYMNAFIDFCEDATLTETIPVEGVACFPIINNCQYYKSQGDCVSEGTQLNPYIHGLRGNWHPIKGHAYVTGRTAPNLIQLSDPNNALEPLPVNVQTDIRNDGTYGVFNPFWLYSQSSNSWVQDNTNWQWASEVTKFLPYNFVIENCSPLDIYSSAVYGYDYKLPVAVAGNAEFHQVTSVDFESESDVSSLCRARFLIGNGEDFPALTSNHAHSGKQSMLVDQANSISAFHPLKVDEVEDPNCSTPRVVTNYLKKNNCLGNFSPSVDEYILSVWVKSASYDNPAIPVKASNYDHAGIDILINGDLVTDVTEARSSIIDGWQQVEYAFAVTEDHMTDPGADIKDIEIKFKNTDPMHLAYFDDLRIHPADASMVSYVYDPIELRLVAQGDERNYFTFYSYRPDGGLTGTMRETARGKQSLNYNEANAAKVN